ncbi:MAG: radical SAM protein [Ruminococcaceae bacterium]|nr:radical SAM protein [Oscillospiraceae bacterium]
MICNICPRRCGAERTETSGTGFCRMPAGLVAARAMLHQWEEPCLSGTRGAGCVFFTGCNLGCVYCQNGPISHESFGKPISPARLREIFDALVADGAHCIDLVTPTHFTPWILEALREPLPVPVVWNCGGYESVETLRALEGKVQIYLPDLKYADAALAGELSAAPDYFAVAQAAIDEMLRQTGPYRMGEDGLLQSGVLIRHMVLPGKLDNTRRVIDYVAARFRPGEVLFSLMSQYTPQKNASGALARRITGAEYRAAVEYMSACGITDGFVQEKSSAKEEYTPEFDLTGIL